MKEMQRKGLLGSKIGKGFYWKKGKDIYELNPATFDYEPQKKLRSPSLEMAKQIKGTKERIRTLLYSNDKVGLFLWNIFAPVLLLSAELLGEIADDLVSIDRALKWGFNWRIGPFEIWMRSVLKNP